MERIYLIGIAIVLDWILGDPYWMPHPIRGIGWLIKRLEELVGSLAINKRAQGVVLWIGVVGSTYALGWAVIVGLTVVHPVAGKVGQVILIYTCLAARCLELESRKVLKELEKGDLAGGRRFLSYLVGRETANLSEGEVIRGTVETVAENTVDGVVAPLFFALLGGAPLVLAYKAVNTLDSMVGYKNEKYLELGWASARIDDWMNLIPARLTALLIPLATLVYNGRGLSSFRIMLRDRKNHSSPNSGHPEAAVAGALQVQLGGANYYFGKLVEKPTIGDPLKPLSKEMIGDTIRLMYITEILAYLVFVGFVVWLT